MIPMSPVCACGGAGGFACQPRTDRDAKHGDAIVCATTACYARGSVPHPFGAGPRGHPVRERMRNYLWRSLLTNANYEERIPFVQGHGVPRVVPSNKGRIGFVCPKTVLRHPPTHQHPALPYRGITGSTNAEGCCASWQIRWLAFT